MNIITEARENRRKKVLPPTLIVGKMPGRLGSIA
jgi:hypothetical protein